jgi:hypothetical protein
VKVNTAPVSLPPAELKEGGLKLLLRPVLRVVDVSAPVAEIAGDIGKWGQVALVGIAAQRRGARGKRGVKACPMGDRSDERLLGYRPHRSSPKPDADARADPGADRGGQHLMPRRERHQSNRCSKRPASDALPIKGAIDRNGGGIFKIGDFPGTISFSGTMFEAKYENACGGRFATGTRISRQ